MDIKFKIDKDASFTLSVDYDAEPLTPQQMWGNYITAYETQIAALKTDIDDIVN